MTDPRGRIEDFVAVWSTPRASDAEKGSPNQSFGAGGTPLPAQAINWPTPTASSYGSNQSDSPNATVRPSLQQIAAQWGTPTVRDHKDGTAEACANVPVNGLLGRQAAQWATPTLNGDYNRKGASPNSGDGLATQVTDRFSLPGQPTSTDGSTTSNSGRSLNPQFVGWLMGWPDGWTSFECSATELSAFKQRMRSALSQLVFHDAPPAQNDLFA